MNLTTSNIGFSYGDGYSNLKIVRRNIDNQVVTKSILAPVGGSNRFDFHSVIAKNSEATFDIYVDANDDVPISNFKIYLNRLGAIGQTSQIEATITGDPTGYVNVNVN